MIPATGASEPHRDCPLCPRLHAFIGEWRQREPGWVNAPVPTWAAPDDEVELLIVGLAPGLRGANRTGRPFTGDFAGELLYSTLVGFGFAEGSYRADPQDGLRLKGAAITNAVRCVPPQNKPVGEEINTCRRFLTATLQRFPRLRAVISLGAIAHQSTVRALGLKFADHPFAHGAQSEAGHLALFASYHCSRYNTNTGRLTEEMFVGVFRQVRSFLDES